MAERSAAELKFIDQRTRQLMVQWAEHSIRNPEGIPDLDSIPPHDPGDHDNLVRSRMLKTARDLEMHRVYFDFAISKGWLGKKVTDGNRKLTSSGWSTAAAFLKR